MLKFQSILMLGGVAVLTACGGADAPSSEPAETPEPPAMEDVAAPPTETTASQPAEPAGTEPVRQADAHTHGDASLAVVLDGSTLTLELDTPLYNLVGFEHAPETDEQRAAVEAAETLLRQPGTLFQVNSEAGCAPSSETLEVHLDAEDHSDHDGHHDDEHDGHKDEHDHHDDHDDHEGEETHKDVVLEYSFSCSSPGELAQIETALMSSFPNMEELEVVYLGPNRQDLFTLTPSDSKIQLAE